MRVKQLRHAGFSCGLSRHVLMAFAVLNLGYLNKIEAATGREAKPYRLAFAMSASTTLDGVTNNLAERSTPIAKAVAQLVVDTVNARNDILDQYQLELIFSDEGPDNAYALRNAIAYLAVGEGGQSNSVIYQSPLMVAGDGYLAGCNPLAKLFQLNEFDYLLFAIQCTDSEFPIITGNRDYPNTYRLQASSSLQIWTTVAFITQVGRWKNVLIFADVTYSTSVETAKTLYRECLRVAVKASLEGLNFNDQTVTLSTLARFSMNETTIFIIQSNNQIQVYGLLCNAYTIGITGGKYVFILPVVIYMDPTTLSQSTVCTSGIIAAQLKITFFVGPSVVSTDPARMTTLKHNRSSFDKLLSSYIGNVDGPSLMRTLGFLRRDIYYDAVLQAVMTLDAADKKLKDKLNLSLRDYADYPNEVMDAMTESAASVDYLGMRAGRTRYSRRFEVDDESQFIFQWSRDRGLQPYYEVRLRQQDLHRVDGVNYFKRLNTIPWQTEDNQPPRGTSTGLIKRTRALSRVAFYVIFFCALLLALCQAVLMLFLWLKRQDLNYSQKYPIAKCCCFLAGCFILDISAVMFVFISSSSTDETDQMNYTLCKAWISATDIGLTLVHGFLFFRLGAFFRNDVQERRLSTRFTDCEINIRRRSSSSIMKQPGRKVRRRRASVAVIQFPNLGVLIEDQAPLPTIQWRRLSTSASHSIAVLQLWVAIFPTLVLTVIHCIVLVLWFLLDSVTLSDPTNSLKNLTDFFANDRVIICPSTQSSSNCWLSLLVAFQAFPLFSGIIFTGKRPGILIRREQNRELKVIRLTIFNETLILFVIVVCVVSFGTRSLLLTQQTVVVVGILLCSLTNSLMIFSPLLQQATASIFSKFGNERR